MKPVTTTTTTAMAEGISPAPPERTYGGNKAFHNFYNDYSHISDPNLRRRLALSEIDKVPFGLYRTSSRAPRACAKRAPQFANQRN